jgi:phospholipid/cholesterol/gamma-HCH transport system substrate-binding protein
MTTKRRHIIVGLTVLTALASLGWMILQFGGDITRPFAPEQIPVTFNADRADGLGNGSPVFYLGVEVGRIGDIKLNDDGRGVTIHGHVAKTIKLPANVSGSIRTAGVLGGSATMTLDVPPEGPSGQLAAEATIPAKFQGLSVLPPEVASLARELELTAVQFRESNLIGNLNEQIRKVGTVLDSMQAVVGDKGFQGDVKASIARLREITEKSAETAENVRVFSQRLDAIATKADGTIDEAKAAATAARTQIEAAGEQIARRSADLAKLLDQANELTAKVNRGEGTMGLLVNDPKLYAGLVDNTRELQAAIGDLRRLMQQWEQEGVQLKLR